MTPRVVAASGSRDTTERSASVPGGGGGKPSTLRAFVVTTSVIVMSAAVLLWRLLDTFSFLNDDLIQFDVASRTGLSTDLLLMNVFQHFGPVNRALHLMLFSVGELNPNFAAVASCCWWCASWLRPPGWPPNWDCR